MVERLRKLCPIFCAQASLENQSIYGYNAVFCIYYPIHCHQVNITTFDIPHPNYQCITVLRCLYQRDHNQQLWNKIQSLQSHCEDRKDTDKWNNDKKMIAEFIWQFFKLKETFSEDEIMKCCGILQVIRQSQLSGCIHIIVCSHKS